MRFSIYLLMALSLAACSGDSTPTPTADAATDVSVDQPASDTPAADVTPDTTPADVTQADAATDTTPADVATDTTPADVATDTTPADAATDAATDATPADAATDATPADAATDAGSTFMAFAPCNAESDYMSATTVSFGGTLGSVYSPRCVTVRAGSSLTFSGSFGGHPLRPSTRGTASNPIPSTDSGSSVMVTFPAVGFYPYYCSFHGTDSGSGMAGVVRVIP